MTEHYSQYEETVKESKNLASRNRNGTGASSLLQAQDAPTHYADSLERFQKDFASYEKQRREDEKYKRQSDLEKKRIEQLERENRRWEAVDNYHQKLKDREEYSVQNQVQGIKRTANSNGLAYNPISLEYDRNPEGDKLKRRDEDAKIRGYVRAHNMDHRGNSKYNPLTGEDRVGIEKVIPNDLTDRYENKLYEHYEHMRLKVPSSASSGRIDQPNVKYF